MSICIAIVSSMSAEQKAELSTLADIELRDFSKDRDGLAASGSVIDVVYGNVRDFELPKLPNLKWIQATWAGVENLCYPEMIKRHLIITNVRGASAVSMVEHALAGSLYFCRDLPAHSRANQDKSWKRDLECRLLAEDCIAILGTGGIGRLAVSRYAAMGCRVIAVNRSGEAIPDASLTCRLQDFSDHLPEVNQLLLCLPLTDETRGLVDKSWFDQLPDQSLLINISRGAVVNEADMLQALDAGKLAAAWLDVAATEPLPEDSPLWDHQKVFITGHRSWKPGPVTGSHPAFDVFKENLSCFLDGRLDEMQNRVNLEQGY